MNWNSGRVTRSTARRLQCLPKIYREGSGVSILVTPSATGKGIHMRWQYPEPISKSGEARQPGHFSGTNPLARELTIHMDDTYAHLFDGSLSSIDSTPSLHDAEGDTVDDNRLFEGSLSSISSTSSVEQLAKDSTTMEVASEEETARTPRATTPTNRFPEHIVFRPDEFTAEAILRRSMREEQRIEETFQAQWQKMLEQRQIALRTIEGWTQKVRRAKDDTRSDESAEEEDDDDRHMEIDAEDHAAAVTGPSAGGTSAGSSQSRGHGGPAVGGTPPRRRLGPCGTVIIDNPYMHDGRTSPPPVYPQEWVTRKLAGRDSTESVEDPV